MSASPLTLRVFLSSPGDVAEERRRAREVMETLEAGHLLRGRVRFDIVAWDDERAAVPMDGRETPQTSVNRYAGRPADCDLTLVVLWSRLGTPLPPDIARPDGTRYQSGTVWEYEDATAANRPVFVYCRTDTPQIALDAPDFEARRAQFAAVKGFFARFTNTEGSLQAGFNSYPDPERFSDLLRQHLEAFVNDRLGGRSTVTLPAVTPDDPRVEQILILINELGRKNRQLAEKDAEIERLVRERDDLRRAAIARTLTAAAQPDASADAVSAAHALSTGDTRPAEVLLRHQEREETGQLGRADADEAALRGRAAALAREQGALAMGHDVKAALTAYLRAAEYEPGATWTHFFVGDLYLRLGTLELAMQSYRTAAGTARDRLQRMPGDAEAQRDLSVSENKIGDVLVAQGDYPAALASYRQALAIAEALAARDPLNARWQRDLSVSQNKIGDFLMIRGNHADALVAYRQGLEIRETLAARDPAATLSQHDLSMSHDRIGDVLAAQGDRPGALAAYRQALAIRTVLAGQDPASPQWQRDLSVSHDRIGTVLVAQGDAPGALAVYEQGQAIAEALAGQDPANTEWQRDLSVSCDRIGDVLVTQKRPEDALAAYRRSLTIAEALAARDPANTQWQRDLSLSHTKVGDVLTVLGDRPGALSAYREGQAVAERLAARDAANVPWQRDLAVSHTKVGDALLALGETASALAVYRQALAAREAIVACDPANPQWVTDVALFCGRLGALAQHAPDVRLTYLKRGHEMLTKLKEEGRLPRSRKLMAWFERQIGRIQAVAD